VEKLSSDSPEILLSRLLSSRIKGELLLLFHRNPGLVDHFEGVGRRIGRSPNEVKNDLNDLVEMGVLKKESVGSTEIVYLDKEKDEQTKNSVGDYLASRGS
jgi:predicted transcriptional regulator